MRLRGTNFGFIMFENRREFRCHGCSSKTQEHEGQIACSFTFFVLLFSKMLRWGLVDLLDQFTRVFVFFPFCGRMRLIRSSLIQFSSIWHHQQTQQTHALWILIGPIVYFFLLNKLFLLLLFFD